MLPRPRSRPGGPAATVAAVVLCLAAAPARAADPGPVVAMPGPAVTMPALAPASLRVPSAPASPRFELGEASPTGPGADASADRDDPPDPVPADARPRTEGAVPGPGAVDPAAAQAPAAPRPVPAMRDESVSAALWGLVEQSQRLVRAYAQLGTDVRAAAAAAAVPDALRTGDRLLAALAAGAQRRVPAARSREIGMRWRALRDAVATRPAPEIARLMDDVSRQLAALAADSAAALPPASRATRRRTLLHRMAGAHLLACWGALPPAPGALLAMRAKFGHLLAEGADPGADDLDAATLASQWGLLAEGLDGHGPPCDPAAATRVASTADRLAQLLDAPVPKPVAARRP